MDVIILVIDKHIFTRNFRNLNRNHALSCLSLIAPFIISKDKNTVKQKSELRRWYISLSNIMSITLSFYLML